MTSKLTIEQAKRLRNDFECWQQDCDPKDDKEQYDMFGRGMAAMDMLIAGMYQEPVAYIGKQWTLVYYTPPMSMGLKIGDKLNRHAQQPVVPDALADAFITAIEKKQDRLHEEDYLMDSKDCIDVIREEVQRLNANRTTTLAASPQEVK
ncbi:hypothetical protein DJ548_01820 [Klebsiella grimontii]|uniref:hypothetical protein n=1 Tax=Klebsiella grimontii TaxID=2058152 RepID=UPI0011E45F63|nr:hypothetical protein [Klebsiella grimontii]TYG10931.1 hypothetical protein DJ548_01820 [Klebsiella grimontii]DAY86979.1 MAG TPA: hypothetical protein [Caudoviricetes sp.]